MLDMRTVLILTFSYSLLLGMGIFLFGIGKRRALGLKLIGTGVFLNGLGFFVLSRRDYLSEFFTVIVANLLVVIGVSLMLEGLTRFRRYKINWLIQHLVLNGIVLGSFLYLTYVRVNISLRVVVISLAMIILFAEMTIILFKDDPGGKLREKLIISLFFVVSIFLLIIRIGITLLGPRIISFMEAGTIHTLSVAIFPVMPFILSITTFWMSGREMEQELVALAMTDSLTGLYNRGAILELAEAEFSSCRRHGGSLGVAIGDLDHFKEINDGHGHLVGDKALIRVGQIMKDNLRQEDLLGRYGGEEFLVVIPGVTREEFIVILEKLRIRTNEEAKVVDGMDMNISISFGGLVVDGFDELTGTIIMADKAMYEAKHEGRNRTIVYDRR